MDTTTNNQAELLVQEIARISEGSGSVTFGTLARDDVVAKKFEALLCTLKAARKKGILDFKGDLLLMGFHDDVLVTLCKDSEGAVRAESVATPETAAAAAAAATVLPTHMANDAAEVRPCSCMQSVEACSTELTHDVQPPTTQSIHDTEAMVQGLLHGRVYWYGDLRSDLWFWIKQTHAVLGIFLCHKMHPYSHRERFAEWLCCGCASFAVGLLLVRSTGEKRSGASVVSVINGCILAVLHMLMKILATCGCMQDGSPLHSERCQRYCEKCGCLIMTCICFNVFFLLSLCIYFALWADVPIDHVFQVWAQSQVVAFASSIATCIARFMFKWYGLRVLFPGQGGPDGARPKNAYPFGHALPADPQVLPGGDRCCCCPHTLPASKSVDKASTTMDKAKLDVAGL